MLIFIVLDKAEIKLIKHAFLEMDTDKDGLITVEDLHAAKKNHLIVSEKWMGYL